MTNATIVIGLACLLAGLWLATATWPLLRQAALAAFIMILMVGGALAVLIGVSERRDLRARRERAE